jgi:hypothetical protein
MTIAVNNDSPHISEAFKSVQLICSDFIFNLPPDCLALFITTIGCYGLQSSDINISLTAIGLLWPIADFLIRHGHRIEQKSSTDAATATSTSGTAAVENRDTESQDGQQQATREVSSHEIETHASPTVGRLWISVFTEMKQLCLDRRFEVRNCALLTMFKTLQMHGSALVIDTWEHCIWEILVPILVEVKSAAAAAANDELNVEIGKQVCREREARAEWFVGGEQAWRLTYAKPPPTQGGKSVKLLVHHSRNNAQKQWNETCVLAFNGTMRIVRNLHRPVLHRVRSFSAVWTRLLEFAAQFAAATSAEVSVNAVTALHDVTHTVARTDMPEALQARKEAIDREEPTASVAVSASPSASASTSPSESLPVGPGVFVSAQEWKELWRAWQNVANAVADNPPAIDSVANALLLVHPVVRPFLDTEDVLQLLCIFANLSTMATGTKDNEVLLSTVLLSVSVCVCLCLSLSLSLSPLLI